MTATEELRAELTRRGVKWKRMRGHKHDGTEWHDASGAHVSAVQEYTWDGTEWPEGKLHVNRAPACLTPEQAIAVTLGSGTCHDTGESRVFHCSECGFGIEDAYVEDERAYPPEGFPRFCPWCGAEVVRK